MVRLSCAYDSESTLSLASCEAQLNTRSFLSKRAVSCSRISDTVKYGEMYFPNIISNSNDNLIKHHHIYSHVIYIYGHKYHHMKSYQSDVEVVQIMICQVGHFFCLRTKALVYYLALIIIPISLACYPEACLPPTLDQLKIAEET